MNCNVCGNPLIYDRSVFHCSCDAFVHSYCWDEHILRAHKPPFEIGSVNLDGEFKVRESRKEELVVKARVPGKESAEEQKEPTLQ